MLDEIYNRKDKADFNAQIIYLKALKSEWAVAVIFDLSSIFTLSNSHSLPLEFYDFSTHHLRTV